MQMVGMRVACHADCWCACYVGGAVPWGLVLGVLRGWRCAMRIAGVRVACVCGLLVRASRGWGCVIGIADQGVVWVAPCH